MLDNTEKAAAIETGQEVKTYDLIVIGAGIAGLNALNAAVEYLPKNARVLLLDQKDRAGGMWNTAYDYVRLHQPHPMFTVGNQKWSWSKPRGYLAARDEVQSHLASALRPISEKVELEFGFGQTVSHCEEVGTARGPMARVTFHQNDAPQTQQTAFAERAIHASGLNYRKAEPLAFSSDQVVSIVPQDLRETLKVNPAAPVYIVGGGKTGMDSILAVLSQDPKRPVTLINGRGTNFLNRTKFVPNGIKRWTSGRLISRLFRDMAMKFDGTNEEDCITFFRETYSTDTQSKNGVFLYGLQSEEEHQRIQNGLTETVNDYLVDVVPGTSGLQLRYRSGTKMPIPDGSIFVNCTGSFFRDDEPEMARPCVSPHGAVLAINARSSFHFLTSVSGFFATHLLFRDSLRGNGFYSLDHEALFRKNRNAWVGASSAQAYLNQVLAVQKLPLMLLDRCGLDLDRWYPLPRRMAGLMSMKANAKGDIAHCQKVLDDVARRFDVDCSEIR